jgi:hypothetical protein
MKEREMLEIARWIDEGVAAAKREDESEIARIVGEVLERARAFPIPGAPGLAAARGRPR